MEIVTWAQLREAIVERSINEREERNQLEAMEGWKDDGYSAEWTAKRMGYRDAVEEDKTFYIYWRDGRKQQVVGRDIADAFSKAGYGGGAINAVDFYSSFDTHEWDAEKRTWENMNLNVPQPEHSATAGFIDSFKGEG